MPQPIAIVQSQKQGGSPQVGQQAAGQILFCNAQFEKMISERLGMQGVPQSIFRLTKDDEESTQKLKGIMILQKGGAPPSPMVKPDRRNSNTSATSNPTYQSPDTFATVEIKLSKVSDRPSLSPSRRGSAIGSSPSNIEE